MEITDPAVDTEARVSKKKLRSVFIYLVHYDCFVYVVSVKHLSEEILEFITNSLRFFLQDIFDF